MKDSSGCKRDNLAEKYKMNWVSYSGSISIERAAAGNDPLDQWPSGATGGIRPVLML